MAVRKPVIQNVVLENGSLTATVDLRQGVDDGRGTTTPENIVMVYQGNSLIDGTETLDVQGYALGNDTVITALLVSQITVAASNVVKVDLSTAAKGCWKLLFTADALTAGEEISISILTW